MRLSCVTSRMVVPRSRASDCMRSTTSRPEALSSDAVGSSASTIDRLADQGTRNGNALPLAARELLRTLVGVLAEADGLEHRVGLAPSSIARLDRSRAGRAARSAKLSMRRAGCALENEADAFADVFESRALRAVELVTEHAQPSLLRRPQRTDERQQRRLARPRWPRDDDDFARRDRRRDVVQDLPAQRALAVVVVEVLDDDGRVRGGGIRRPPPGRGGAPCAGPGSRTARTSRASARTP